MFEGSKVLVAGGGGFIGCNVIKKLLSLGANVRATLYHRPAAINDDRIEYAKCDLTQQSDCQALMKGVDYVFICSANTTGAADVEYRPMVHVTPNVIMNTLIMEAAYEAKVKKLLFISSNAVYPVTEHPVKEDEMMSGPLYEKYFCVGWMKRFCEMLCEMYSTKINSPMPVVVIRPGNTYGPHDDFRWESSHVLPALMRKIIERHQPLEVWGTGNNIKDFIYIDDLVDGMILAMEKTEVFDIFNLASGKTYSLNESLKMMLEIDGYDDANVVYDASKPDMIGKRFLSITKAKSVLGFNPKTSIRDGLAQTINWFRNSTKKG